MLGVDGVGSGTVGGFMGLRSGRNAPLNAVSFEQSDQSRIFRLHVFQDIWIRYQFSDY